jgi:hypothetical protein
MLTQLLLSIWNPLGALEGMASELPAFSACVDNHSDLLEKMRVTVSQLDLMCKWGSKVSSHKHLKRPSERTCGLLADLFADSGGKRRQNAENLH